MSDTTIRARQSGEAIQSYIENMGSIISRDGDRVTLSIHDLVGDVLTLCAYERSLERDALRARLDGLNLAATQYSESRDKWFTEARTLRARLDAILEALRPALEVSEQATAGPWASFADTPEPLYGVASVAGDRVVEVCREPEHDERAADMAFIAAAANAVRDVAALEASKEEEG